MAEATTINALDRAFLDAVTAGHVTTTFSDALPVSGNAVMLEGLLINESGLNGTNILTLRFEGSYDGRVWLSTNLDAATDKIEFKAAGAPDRKTITRIDGLDYAYLRVKAELSGSSAMALFDATVTFSQQS